MKHTIKRISLWVIACFSITALAHSQSFENDRIYNAYLKIQEATMAGEFEAALQGINKLASYKTSPVETAAILRARGFILLNLKRESEALEDFQKALATGALNTQMQQEMRFIVTNLLASDLKWQEAYTMYKQWLQISTSEVAEAEDLPAPDADAYSLGASIASNCNDYPASIEYTEKAIALETKPKRELYNLLVALHFQAKELKKAVSALQRALANFPDDEDFWSSLSGIYQMLKEDKGALAALVIAYEEGLMDSEEEYLLLGRYYLFSQVPYNGALVISKGIESGLVKKSQENLELLSQAWYSAKEYDKSLKTLIQIVETTGDEEATLRASQILIDKEEYQEALKLLELCTARPDLDEPGTLYKLQGYAHYGLKNYHAAVESFIKSAEFDPDEREAAEQWVDYLRTEFIEQADS